MFDVVALGESLIDFTPNGTNAQGIELFARNPGGAPANVLAMNAHLGGKTAFIGKVGKDGFGDFLRQRLAPQCCIFQIAFAIRFNFVAFKNKHDFSHTA